MQRSEERVSSTFEPVPPQMPLVGIADDNDRRADRRWQPPPATAAGTSADPERQPARDGCLIIGPSNAGKTSLLLALQRACGLPEAGDPDIRFVPTPNTADLVRRAVRIMTDYNSTPVATGAATDYEFDIVLQENGRSQTIPMMLCDGPGGAFFPSELKTPFTVEDRNRWEEHLLERARLARALVLCVDSTNPASDKWEERLPKLLAMASSGRRLSAQRILVLLTKIDTLCHRAKRTIDRLTTTEDSRATVAHSLNALTVEAMAHAIDPLEQVRALLGVYVLNELRSAAPDDARIAVGLCSAGGFLRPGGTRYWLDNGKPAIGFTGSRATVLRGWTPWGIREALYFLVRGEARRPVHLLRRDDMLNDVTPNVQLLHVGGVQAPVGEAA